MDSPAPILYYAFGGGFGHLTRALAVRHTLALQGDFVVLSSEPAVPNLLESATCWLAPANLQHDVSAFRLWLHDAIARFQPRQFFVDAFPAGILGELCDFPWPIGLELVHVARILRWDIYANLISGSLPHYAQTWLVEEVAAAQHRVIEAASARIAFLSLEDPPTISLGDNANAIQRKWAERATPVWLIVHAGPDAEIAELLAYARECAAQEAIRPHFAVISPGTPLPDEPDIERINLRPASLLFPFAARIVTACGFNSMRQAAAWRERHLCMPFARRFDDQFLRRKQMLGRSAARQGG